VDGQSRPTEGDVWSTKYAHRQLLQCLKHARKTHRSFTYNNCVHRGKRLLWSSFGKVPSINAPSSNFLNNQKLTSLQKTRCGLLHFISLFAFSFNSLTPFAYLPTYLLTHLHFPGAPELAGSLSVFFLSYSGTEPLGISGKGFWWARCPACHFTQAVSKHWRRHKALTPPVAWPHPFFIHHVPTVEIRQGLIRRWDSERELLHSAPGRYPNLSK